MEAGQPRASTVSVALFASGSGSNVAALLDHRHTGAARPRYRCLIGNNSDARVMALARARGVPAYHVSRRTHPQRAAYVARLLEILTGHRIELIVLAGYVKLLPEEIVRRWRRRILNVHPALLPRHGGRGMYGMAPHRAVLAAGERETGVTVHFADEEYDRGPILMQRAVPVLPADTPESLARRVLAAEHDTYWRAVEQVAAELAAGNEQHATGAAPAQLGNERDRSHRERRGHGWAVAGPEPEGLRRQWTVPGGTAMTPEPAAGDIESAAEPGGSAAAAARTRAGSAACPLRATSAAAAGHTRAVDGAPVPPVREPAAADGAAATPATASMGPGGAPVAANAEPAVAAAESPATDVQPQVPARAGVA